MLAPPFASAFRQLVASRTFSSGSAGDSASSRAGTTPTEIATCAALPLSCGQEIPGGNWTRLTGSPTTACRRVSVSSSSSSSQAPQPRPTAVTSSNEQEMLNLGLCDMHTPPRDGLCAASEQTDHAETRSSEELGVAMGACPTTAHVSAHIFDENCVLERTLRRPTIAACETDPTGAAWRLETTWRGTGYPRRSWIVLSAAMRGHCRICCARWRRGFDV